MFSICQGAGNGIEPFRVDSRSLPTILHALPLRYTRHVLLSYSTLLLSVCQAPFLEKIFFDASLYNTRVCVEPGRGGLP
jgi:hypothetical protein